MSIQELALSMPCWVLALATLPRDRPSLVGIHLSESPQYTRLADEISTL